MRSTGGGGASGDDCREIVASRTGGKEAPPTSGSNNIEKMNIVKSRPRPTSACVPQHIEGEARNVCLRSDQRKNKRVPRKFRAQNCAEGAFRVQNNLKVPKSQEQKYVPAKPAMCREATLSKKNADIIVPSWPNIFYIEESASWELTVYPDGSDEALSVVQTLSGTEIINNKQYMKLMSSVNGGESKVISYLI